MGVIDKTLLSVLSDLFVNLAAGWLGAAFIAPNFSRKKGLEKFIILTSDIMLAIFCLGVGFILKKAL